MILLKSLSNLSFQLAHNQVKGLNVSLPSIYYVLKGILHLASKECHGFIPSPSPSPPPPASFFSLPCYLATGHHSKRTCSLEQKRLVSGFIRAAKLLEGGSTSYRSHRRQPAWAFSRFSPRT